MSVNEMYAEIDLVLFPWAMEHKFRVICGFFGRLVRFFYVSAGMESYQIVIEVTEICEIEVSVHSVETIGDFEFSIRWISNIDELRSCLDRALLTIHDVGKRAPLI